MRCICDWPDECDGDGMLYCEGCGGDSCGCANCFGNGEVECPGCRQCKGGLEDEEGSL